MFPSSCKTGEVAANFLPSRRSSRNPATPARESSESKVSMSDRGEICQRPTVRLQDAAQFTSGGVLLGDLAQSRSQVGSVEGTVKVRERLGVTPSRDDGYTTLACSTHRVVEPLFAASCELERVEEDLTKELESLTALS